MDKVEEVWVIEDSGICLFNQSVGNVEEILFSGFLSSIQTFIQTLGEEKLRKIELGDSKLTILNIEEYNIFIVLKSPKKTKDKYLEKKIQDVHTRFIVKFGPVLVEHQVKKLPYNTAVFQDFHKVLDDIFMDSVDRSITDWMRKF